MVRPGLFAGAMRADGLLQRGRRRCGRLRPFHQAGKRPARSRGGFYLISNVVGAPLVHDNNGYITVLDPNGAERAPRFIAGGQSGVDSMPPRAWPSWGRPWSSPISTSCDASIDAVACLRIRWSIEGAEFLNDVLAWDEGASWSATRGQIRSCRGRIRRAREHVCRESRLWRRERPGLARAMGFRWWVTRMAASASFPRLAGSCRDGRPGELDGAGRAWRSPSGELLG